MAITRGDVKVTAVTDELEITTEGQPIHYKRIAFTIRGTVLDSVRLSIPDYLNNMARNAAIMERAHAAADTLDFEGE